MLKNILYKNYRAGYSKVFQQFRIYSSICDNFYYWLTPLSRVDTLKQVDITHGSPVIQVLYRRKGICKVCITSRSSIWKSKKSFYIFTPEGIEHYIEIQGSGILDRLYFCMGLLDGMVIGSIPGFDSFIPGCPNFLTKKEFFSNEYFSNKVANEPTHWGLALNSGPLIYIFSKENVKQRMWAGLVVKKGENTFDCFDFNYKTKEVLTTNDGIINAQSFSLGYFGNLSVKDVWESPHLFFGFARDKGECMKDYCRLLEKRKSIQLPVKKKTFIWWHKPIFCGWHEQVALGEKKEQALSRVRLESGRTIMDECTQDNHEKWLRIVQRHKIPVGTIIIDAKWQKEFAGFEVDTRKWHDMRGFIDRCHAQGIKVVLWILAWSKEGLGKNECILKDNKPVAMDPTSPNYRKRLEDGITYMLSPKNGCLNADGLKIDGTNQIPVDYNVKVFGDIHGFELQHYYLDIIYKQAKKVKKDALISLYTASPYFRDVCDMVRVGDLYTTYGRSVDTLIERAEVLKIAMSQKPLDTDGNFRFSMEEDFLKELKEQVKLGIPTIYQAEYLFQHRAFNKPVIRKFSNEDYSKIRKIFNDYLKEIIKGR